MWRSCGIARPSTLNSYHQASFNHFDHFSHPESKASQRLVTLTVIWVWPRIQTEVCLWQQQYLTCQASKIYRHAKAPLQLLPLPAHRFYTVLDIGLYPEGTGMYLRASIDSRCLMCWRNRQHWRFSPAVSLTSWSLLRSLPTAGLSLGLAYGRTFWVYSAILIIAQCLIILVLDSLTSFDHREWLWRPYLSRVRCTKCLW